MRRTPKTIRQMWLRCAIGILACTAATVAIGADLPPAPVPVRQPPSVWQFQATGYGWATALNGRVGVRNLPPVKVDMSFNNGFTYRTTQHGVFSSIAYHF